MPGTLVTGASGHIGSAIIARLARAGESIVAADIMPPKQPLPDGVRFARSDITIANEFRDLVLDARPERIFHLAGMLTGASEQRPHAAFQVNVIGLYNVLEAARIGGVKRMIFASTGGTFSRDLPAGPVDDYTLQRPRTHYGAAKLYGEHLGRWYHDKHGLDFRVVRYANVIAPGVRAPLHWIPHMLDDALAGQPHVCTEATADSTASIISIGDTARAAIDLSDAPIEKIKTRCYTVLGFPNLVTARDLADQLTERFPGFTVEFPAPPTQRRSMLTFDDRYAREEWGWNPVHGDLDSLLRDFRSGV